MNIAFIGGGNMATSLIGGLIADGFAPESIAVADIDSRPLENLKQRYGVQTYDDANEAVRTADTVVFSVKPQVLKSVTLNVASLIQAKNPLIISIVAGIRTADIEHWLGSKLAVVRAMPNTPALVQCGASGLYATARVNPEQREKAESILRATGLTVWVEDEEQINAITALSGSGPAYFFRIMESLELAGVKLGLAEDTARLLTLQTALGTAKLAMESPDSVAKLRESVTSPGGTTEQGLRVLNEQDIDRIFEAVLHAACERAKQLADELGNS